MEYIISRPEVSENSKELAADLYFNLWGKKNWPYHELHIGNVLYWYETRSSYIVWKSRVIEVERFFYQDKDHLRQTLKSRFGPFKADHSYLIKKPVSGHCLAYKIQPLEKLHIPKPKSLNFPRLGWLRTSDPLAGKWLSGFEGKDSGEEPTVRRELQQRGSIVRRNSDAPLVLAENEVTFGGRYDHWQDVTGERYHFPNQYKNLVATGRPFIYYRGSRRKSGPRRVPEYFGHGFIGEVSRDDSVPETVPKSRWKWFCDIQDYQEFKTPVPFKIDGQSLEQIPLNKFRSGVRLISQLAYEFILKQASVPIESLQDTYEPPTLPDLDRIKITLATDHHLFKVQPPKKPGNNGSRGNHGGSGQARRSRFANMIGNRAEKIVLKHLRECLPNSRLKSLRLVAKDNLGWDIEYDDIDGQRIRIEVKGTSGPAFPNVEFTANEWDAAEKHRETFWLFLVTDCLSAEANIEKIKDPYGDFHSGKIEVLPLQWRLKWVKTS